MGHTITLIFIFGLFGFSYAQNIDTKFAGEWELIETMIDPGDGSGKFNKVNSDKTLTIRINGNIESNGNLCQLTTKADNRTKAQLIRNKNETILDSCKKGYKIYYELREDFLIVYYPCKETCAEKYKKAK